MLVVGKPTDVIGSVTDITLDGLAGSGVGAVHRTWERILQGLKENVIQIERRQTNKPVTTPLANQVKHPNTVAKQ